MNTVFSLSPLPALLPAPPASPPGRAVPHFGHSELRANTLLAQFGQVQSPGLPLPLPLLSLPPSVPGRGVPHCLHWELRPNTLSPQFGHVQSLAFPLPLPRSSALVTLMLRPP